MDQMKGKRYREERREYRHERDKDKEERGDG
jgi:hypothetical protein